MKENRAKNKILLLFFFLSKRLKIKRYFYKDYGNPF